MLSDFANHGLHGLDDLGKVLMVADAPRSMGDTGYIYRAGGFAVLVVDINQIDIAGDVEFACPQFAHAHNPKQGLFTVNRLRDAVAFGQLSLDFAEGNVQ